MDDSPPRSRIGVSDLKYITDSLNVTSVDMKNFLDGGWKDLYPFWVPEYPTNTHLIALGSNLPHWVCT